MVDSLLDGVVAIENQDGCLMGGDLSRLAEAKSHDDDAVSDGGKASGRPVYTDDAAARFSRNDVGFKSVTVLTVGDQNGFVGQEPTGAQEVAVNGDTAVVLGVCVRHNRVMQLGFEQSS